MNELYLIQTLPYILVILGIVFIGGLTFVRRSGNGVIYFSILTFIIALWLAWQALAQLNISNEANLVFIRLTAATSLFIAYFFILFIRDYVNKKTSRILRILYIIPVIVLSISNLTPLGITEITVTNSGISINNAGLLYFIGLIVVSIYLVNGFVLLILDTIRKPKSLRVTNYYIFSALAIAAFINLTVLVFFAEYTFTQVAIPISLLIMVAIIAFAIIRHKLFDIRLVAVRAVTYSLTILIIGFLYGFIAFAFIGRVFSGATGTTQQLLDTILAVVLAFTFQPIRRFFERVTTNIFYRDHYDAQALVNEVGRILASEIDLDRVSNKVLQEITGQIKIDKGEIVVFGEKQLFYENNVFRDGGEQISPSELKKLGRIMLVADDLGSGDRKDLMQKYGVNISMALRTSEKFIGYMLLGEKKSGDIYNDEDLRVLKIIAQEVSVAIANALSYKEIQLFSETLAEKVRQRTEQLRHANDQLKELDKAKDEFISMASHQLRTPLTTVKGYASMLEEGDFGKLSKEQLDTVELTLDGANRMARLIDDLLNVSRMDANRFFLEADKVDIVKLVNEEIIQLKTLASSKKVELKYSPPTSKIPIILLDDNKTRQVIMNLVDNALHYSAPPAGGGHVQVSLALKGENIEFVVKDDGIGVPADAQKKLFTKMFRAANARGVRPDGTGLGLYLVKRVVEEQGGEILFESTPGKGSTFGFRLPLSGIPKETIEQSKKIGAKVAASHKNGS